MDGLLDELSDEEREDATVLSVLKVMSEQGVDDYLLNTSRGDDKGFKKKAEMVLQE